MASATLTSLAQPAPRADDRGLAAVRAWLWVLAGLVFAMALVGAATRLTGSGLSITEWRPVTGIVPPFSAEAWEAEFAKYRAIPQYELLNAGMSLAAFKTIFWWEWAHRLLGRIIGLAFFLPLLWFFAQGVVRGKLALALFALGALGALQGAVGWIMVASGLKPGMVAVAPLKLMLHLTIASAIFAGLVWIATGLGRLGEPVTAGTRRGARALLALVFVQIAAGGLVAGAKAGWTYNTWPGMDGALVPPLSALFALRPWLDNFAGNVLLVQFNHRLLAYALVAAALLYAIHVRRAQPGTGAARRATALAGISIAQMMLGIVTLVLLVPLWAGLAHQALALALLSMAAAHDRLCRPVRSRIIGDFAQKEAPGFRRGACDEPGDPARAGSSRL